MTRKSQIRKIKQEPMKVKKKYQEFNQKYICISYKQSSVYLSKNRLLNKRTDFTCIPFYTQYSTPESLSPSVV